MTKIIINADDFGYSRGINYGIIDSYKNGALTSTTLMVAMPGTDHAVELMQEYPDFPVGLHMNFTLGESLVEKELIPSLLQNGAFIKPKNLEASHEYKTDEVYHETKAQMERFIALTQKLPTHIDTHLFASDIIPEVTESLQQIAKEYKVPLRNHETAFFPKVSFITHRTYNDENSGLDYVLENFADIAENEYAEIMSHPGYLDSEILNNSSYGLKRVEEVDILCSNTLKDLIRKHNVELISYKDIEQKDDENK